MIVACSRVLFYHRVLPPHHHDRGMFARPAVPSSGYRHVNLFIFIYVKHIQAAYTEGSNMKKKFTHHVLLCLIGILINLIGARVAIYFQLPLFLDCLGTIGVAATGGLLPGIVVGFLTNFINCLSDPVTIYYSCINVMIAVCSSYYSAKGYFRKFPDILIVILWLTLLGGGVGSIITWNLYGGGIGEGISAPLATMIYDSHVMNMFFSQLCADICIDLVDKSISVLAVSFVLA
jgi:hypothetical protein